MDILRPEPVPYDPKRAAVTRVVLLLDVEECDPTELYLDNATCNGGAIVQELWRLVALSPL